MIKLKNKLSKLLAAVLISAALGTMSASAVYAEGPAGPASDTTIVAQDRDGATGPGSEQASTLQQEQQAAEQAAAAQAAAEQAAAAQAAAEQAAAEQVAAAQAAAEQAAAAQAAAEQAAAAQAAAEQAAAAQAATDGDGKVMSGGRWLDPSKPMIALTFDDGPYAPVGNRIMDTLEKHNGRATFFIVGNRVVNYKTEVSRMQQNGHEVANHTYEHKYLNKLSAAEVRRQIDKCNEIVTALTGVSPNLVRLPGGLKNNTVMANVHYPMIMWNVDTQDWKTRNAQKTINAVLGKVQDGDIVLMHELYPSTADAIDKIVPALTEQGYQLVTVSEMAAFRGGLSAGKTYNKIRP